MSGYLVSELPLAGLRLIERYRVSDERGFFTRVFGTGELKAAGWLRPVVQINHSMTCHRGTVRGLHFQRWPYAEMKLVSCIRGEVWDVAVDIRPESPTYLQWHAEYLSAANNRALLIPEGFAHGFQALSDGVELIYCHSAEYAPNAEGGLNALDPRLAISWPLEIGQRSPRDAGIPHMEDSFAGQHL